MSPDDFRTILLIATVVGALVTIGGLIAVVVEATREHQEASTRIDTMVRLAEEENLEHKAVAAKHEADCTYDIGPENEEINQRYARLYAEHDIERPSYGNLTYLAAFESKRLLGLVLNSTRRDFIIAMIGLLVSTGASVGSLYL